MLYPLLYSVVAGKVTSAYVLWLLWWKMVEISLKLNDLLRQIYIQVTLEIQSAASSLVVRLLTIYCLAFG